MTIKEKIQKLFKPKKQDTPVRLEPIPLKKPKKKKIKRKYNYTNILIIVSVMSILLISVLLIYKTGSLESTNYYYRM